MQESAIAGLVDGAGRPKSNTQIAIETIKQLILENQLPAGSNHLESELAKKLGMSRTPVREATLILEAQGLLQVRPRHGVKILPLSIDDMREIYTILTELEGLSVELAANNNLDEEEFDQAEAAILAMDEALEREDREDWATADQNFHNELIRLGGNSRVATVVDQYNNQVRRARSLTLHLRPRPTKSNDDHRRVLEAIRDGNPKLARKIHTEHRVQAGTMLISILEKHKLHMV
ncbi:MAG: GntR family transcriptional regulator [Salaquimonas sp.]